MKEKSFKHILVVSLSNIGDVLLTLPVINRLKGNFPQANLSLVIGPKAEGLFYPSSYFKRIIIYDKTKSLFGKMQFLTELWQDRYDLVVDLRNTAIPFLVLARAFNSPFKKKTTAVSMCERHLEKLAFLELAGEKHQDYPLFSESHQTSLEEKLRIEGFSFEDLPKTVVMAPAARFWLKSWPAESFLELAKRVKKQISSQPIILTGSSEECETTQKMAKQCPEIFLDLAGKLTIPEFACLLKHVKLLVSNDSAAMHIANYQAVPNLAIFGPTDPEKYGSRSPTSRLIFHEDLACRPCEKASCPTNRECLNDLPVNQVWSKINDWL